MDILSHTLSGACVAGAVATLGKPSPWKSFTTMGWGVIGAMLPDLDTITLWSQFDAVIGSRLGLAMSGHDIYFGNYWYSHHNGTHSLAAGALVTGFTALGGYLLSRLAAQKASFTSFCTAHGGYLLALFLGYTMHLLGDLPTPGHTWQGIKLLWPLNIPIGGTGHLWWWNNYDIVIILAFGCLGITAVLILYHMLKRPWLALTPSAICLITMVLCIYQITHRPVRFNHAIHAENERQSQATQEMILGERVYRFMVALDRRLAIYF